MKTTFENTDKIYNISWHFFLSKLEIEYATIIVLSQLFERNIITREKLLGQLKSLKAGALTKFKRTYHCEINDRWYNDCPFSDVLEDLAHSEVKINTLIEVIQLHTNKNYNYCIDMIICNIIKPIFYSFTNYGFSNETFGETFKTTILNFPEIKMRGYTTECWECGHSHVEVDGRMTRELGMKAIVDFFHTYKKGNLNKIPKTVF